MKRKDISFLFAVLLLAASALGAQEVCSDQDTVSGCFTRIYQGTKVEAVAADLAKKDVEKKTTGADSFASDLSSSIKNFLPLFGAFVESQTLSEDGNTLTLDLNLPFPNLGRGRTFQTQAVFRKPVVFEQLKSAFPETVRTARTDSLTKKLDDLDDSSLVLSYNMATARMGRSFEPHRDLHSALFLAVADKVPSGLEEALLELGKLAQNNPDVFPETSVGVKFGSIPAEKGLRDLAKSLVERSAHALSEHRSALEERANASGLDLFSDLVNNQPQLYVSAAYRSRRDLVGPDEETAKLSYEKGFYNINTLRGKLGESCVDAAKSGSAILPECLATYSDWIKNNRSRIKAGERLSLSVDYSRDDAYSLQQLADHVDLRLPASHKLTASFAYGRYLMFLSEAQNARLDISAKYEDFTNDATKRDRGVGSITLTRKISETMSLPIGLVYANHGRFLGDVDQKLSAHFGLKFKLSGQ